MTDNHEEREERSDKDAFSTADEVENQDSVTDKEEEIVQTNPYIKVVKTEGDIPDPAFLHIPTYFICPNCNFEGMTKVDRGKGACFTFFYWMPACWMCDWCDDYEHFCPQCRVALGSYNDF